MDLSSQIIMRARSITTEQASVAVASQISETNKIKTERTKSPTRRQKALTTQAFARFYNECDLFQY
jgi:hypothetical protein